MVKSRSVVFSTRRKLGHGVAFYKILTFGAQSIAKKSNLLNQKARFLHSPILHYAYSSLFKENNSVRRGEEKKRKREREKRSAEREKKADATKSIFIEKVSSNYQCVYSKGHCLKKQ